MRSTQRLDKLLSNFGFGTRTEIKNIIKLGVVQVDGKIAKDSSMHVDPEKSVITINQERLNYKKYIYLMMNKPAGVISATYDPRHKTVIDLIPDEFKCLEPFPVGRLDIDTEGLLVLTNDGQMAHELLSPKKHVPKKYYAIIDSEITQSDIDAFFSGVTLDDGYETLPAKLEKVKNIEDENINRILSNSQIENNQDYKNEVLVEITEGKFHQVKRMFNSVDKNVLYLKRISMGKLILDESLELGDVREMTEEEISLLRGLQL